MTSYIVDITKAHERMDYKLSRVRRIRLRRYFITKVARDLDVKPEKLINVLEASGVEMKSNTAGIYFDDDGLRKLQRKTKVDSLVNRIIINATSPIDIVLGEYD